MKITMMSLVVLCSLIAGSARAAVVTLADHGGFGFATAITGLDTSIGTFDIAFVSGFFPDVFPTGPQVSVAQGLTVTDAIVSALHSAQADAVGLPTVGRDEFEIPVGVVTGAGSFPMVFGFGGSGTFLGHGNWINAGGGIDLPADTAVFAVLSAVPEPTTYALMLAGLALVAGIAPARKRMN